MCVCDGECLYQAADLSPGQCVQSVGGEDGVVGVTLVYARGEVEAIKGNSPFVRWGKRGAVCVCVCERERLRLRQRPQNRDVEQERPSRGESVKINE